MTNIIRNQILDKFQNVDEYIGYLNQLAGETKNSKERFLTDFHLFGLAERYLQLTIQVLIDIVQLVIIEQDLKRPENNQEAISLLYNEKIISEDISSRLDGIVGFRNILVHEYGRVDKEKVFEYLQEKIGDFEDFKKEVLEYLRKIELDSSD